MRKIICFFVLFSGAILCYQQTATAEEKTSRPLQSVELLSGFGWNKLHSKDDYNFFPILLSFDFNLKPLIQKINLRPKQLFQLQLEPFISFVSSPRDNLETGANFFLKLGLLPEDRKIQPYIKAGVGLVYMTQHIKEQGTQFNFTETAGIGTHYFLTKNTALTLEYRYRHLSNSGIKEPNRGINTQLGLAGLTYKF